MKMTFKKPLAVLLAAVFTLMLGANAFPALLPRAFAETVTGQCGPNVTYVFDPDTGALTISGTGNMDDTFWESLFSFANDIKSVVVEDGVTRVGDYAFFECGSLQSVSLPDTLRQIGDNAFYNCEALTSVTIPDSVSDIETYAFAGTGITSLTLPKSLREINIHTFSIEGLTSVTIPTSVTKIWICAFQGCGALSTLNYYGGEEDWAAIDIDSDAFDGASLSAPTCYHYGALCAENLISEIGTVTLTAACKARIQAAREAYDRLSDYESTLVTNYKTLTDAEAAFAAFNTGKALQFAPGELAENIFGAQQSNIWFGKYKQSGNKTDGFNEDPVKWRVLSNADGKLFLLSDQNLDVVRYNQKYTSVTWATCTLRKWLNGYDGNPYSDSFIGSAFSGKETAAIAETAVVNDDNPSYGTPGGDDTTDRVFLLSIAEAKTTAYGFMDNNNSTETREATNTEYVYSGGHTGIGMNDVGEADLWWLRSPGSDVAFSSVVDDGFLNDYGGNVDFDFVAVRPAFNLNLNSVLFTSAAAGGKTGDGTLAQIADYDGSEWKLTLLDESRAFAVTETAATAVGGGSVTLNYTGATTGDNEYVSVILADADGSAVYYGRLSQPDAADGTVTFTVPADLAPGSYTLKVFSEQYNGDYKTDYASAFSDVALTVVRPGNGKALQLSGSGEAANILGAQTSAVYFGNYKQSSNGSGGFNVEPVKWRVLKNADGKLFLLADGNLDVVRYNESFNPVMWESCTLRKWLNGCDGNPYEDEDGSFIGNAFSDKETAAIAETAVVNDDNPGYGTPGGSDTTDKVFLLSIAEATDTAYGFTDNYDGTDSRVSRNTAYVASGGHTGGYMYAVGEAALWWLRSPGYDDGSSSIVDDDGYLHDDGIGVGSLGVAVRPAFNLNLNSVLFTSAAAGGKAGDGALAKIADYGGSEWKLTLLDDARAFAVTETEVSAAAGGTAALTCTGAEVGTNEYISAILTDATGSAVYYGRLTQPDAADGTVTFTVPADLSVGSYTMKVFSEQYNGDYKTDFASAFDEVTLTVISKLDAAKAAAKEELAKYKNADDYRAAEQTDLAAAIADGEAAIDAAADIDAVNAALADAKATIDAIKTDAQLAAEEAAAALAAAKTSAKEELAAYKNADDYRDAQKTELTAAIRDGDDAIDAATDIDAVNAALTAAKAAVDAIKTDAQLTAEEAAAALADAKAAAKAELAGYKNADDYRTDEKADLAAAISDGNDAIDAATDIDAVNAALENAKAVIDAIETDAQLTAEELAADKAAFEEYKEAVKTLADGMKLEGDSDACAALIEAAKEAVDAQTYDESKTLDENKEAVDDAAALTQLAAALAGQRAAEADDPQEAFEEYRATLLTLAQALRRDGDSEAVTALIDEAVAALTGSTYDEEKTLAENEDALSDVLSRFADSVRAQRKAERQEYLNHQPCSLCGKHHTGSLLENMIGIIHGLIWIMRSIVLIAA